MGTGGLYADFSGKNITDYEQVITLLYPMHKHGKYLKENYGFKWICYNQGIPPITKIYFPNFFRRQAMRYVNWRNNTTIQGADEYWDVTKRPQKPRWTEKGNLMDYKDTKYAIYLG